MNILIYLFIFFSKIIENMIGTLRIIILNSNRQVFGAILQFTNTLIWIFTTSIVIINVTDDMFKIIVFALGALVGSFLGSKLEEKLAIGDNLVITISKKDIINELQDKGFTLTSLNNNDRYLIFIIIPRYQTKNLIKNIKKIDSNALITFERTNIYKDYK